MNDPLTHSIIQSISITQSDSINLVSNKIVISNSPDQLQQILEHVGNVMLDILQQLRQQKRLPLMQHRQMLM
jgi:hypothetical protein